MAIVSTFITGKPTEQKLKNDVWKSEIFLDFSDTNVSAADVIKAINVPAGAIVLDVLTRVETAEGAAATANIGDGDDPNGYNDAADFNVVSANGGFEAPARGTDAYAMGKYYAADDTIDIVPDHDLDACKVYVCAIMTMAENMS